MVYQSIEVRKLTPTFGAEIFGVDLAKPLGNEQFQEVHDALMDTGDLLPRPEHDDRPAQGFRPPLRPAARPSQCADQIPEHPEILVIKANEKSKRVAGEEWHSDVSCDAEPPMGSILYLTEVPPDGGGDTLFANTYRAYETLSEPIKQLLQGLTALHDSPRRTITGPRRRPGGDEVPQRRASRRAHPSGDRQEGLYVNRGFTRVPALRKHESDALLEMLVPPHRDAAVPVPLPVAANSVAFWDNRCAQHQRCSTTSRIGATAIA